MKRIFAILLTFIFIAFANCKKDDENDRKIPASPLLANTITGIIEYSTLISGRVAAAPERPYSAAPYGEGSIINNKFSITLLTFSCATGTANPYQRKVKCYDFSMKKK